jgi:predicted peptidase
MRKNYNIDESRIYLTGHSMGGIGTWYLGARHPEIWAALAPFSGFGDPSTIVQMKAIPQIIVHGDADPTVAVAGARAMVAELKKQGVEHRNIEVPGGNHLNVVEPHFEDVFAFFDAHRKK